MSRIWFFLAIVFLASCGSTPPEKVQPFIFVEVNNPESFIAPQAETLEIVSSGTVNGEFLEEVFRVEAPQHPLPTTFAIRFSEGVRGTIIDITVRGLVGEQEVFIGSDSAIADTSSLEITVRFCGDLIIDEDRQEQCDDGPSNSDSVADSCRTRCLLPICGDGIVDSVDDCDDANNIDADGCEANCTLPQCQNNIFEPEDFLGNTCFVEAEVSSNFNIREIETGDIDGDGFRDILTVSESNGFNLSILFGDEQGGTKIIRNILLGNQSINSVVFESKILIGNFDFDIENLQDIAVFTGIDRLIIARNLGSRNFEIIETPSLAGNIKDIAKADITGDGFDDFVVLSQSDVFIYSSNLSTGLYNTPVLISNSPTASTFRLLQAKDLNQDGLIDIVISKSSPNEILIGKNFGSGLFIFEIFPTVGILGGGNIHFETIFFSDINRDDQLDIVAASLSSNEALTFFTNDCLITSSSSFPIQGIPFSIKSADLDKDLTDDIFVLTSQNVSLLLSSFDFSVIEIGQPVTPNFNSMFSIGDIDNDNIEDISLIRTDTDIVNILFQE